MEVITVKDLMLSLNSRYGETKCQIANKLGISVSGVDHLFKREVGGISLKVKKAILASYELTAEELKFLKSIKKWGFWDCEEGELNEYGRTVRKIVKRLGWTLEEFCEYAGFAKKSFHSRVRGKRPVNRVAVDSLISSPLVVAEEKVQLILSTTLGVIFSEEQVEVHKEQIYKAIDKLQESHLFYDSREVFLKMYSIIYSTDMEDTDECIQADDNRRICSMLREVCKRQGTDLATMCEEMGYEVGSIQTMICDYRHPISKPLCMSIRSDMNLKRNEQYEIDRYLYKVYKQAV